MGFVPPTFQDYTTSSSPQRRPSTPIPLPVSNSNEHAKDTSPPKMAGGGPPLSLRPVPVTTEKPRNVAEFIARVNVKPGGFRELDERKLAEEIREREEARRREENGEGNGAAGEAEAEDVEMKDAKDEEGEGEVVEEEEDVAAANEKAKFQVLKSLDAAGNNALVTLDFLSLILSKQNPTQASAMLTQHLREQVGIGTMGLDKLDEPTVAEDKFRDQENIAVGSTLMEIERTRDSAKSASSFLARELLAEAKYWHEVLKVKGSGWAVCRVPQERHSLGVRFGFSEADAAFRNRGLAPMRRAEDGSVQLDCGHMGDVSERLYVTYSRHGQVQGRSYLPAKTTSDAPLGEQVLEARNTIFAQELWQELIKESRTLLTYNVKLEGSRLVCHIEPDTTITIQKVPLGPKPYHDTSLAANDTANAILHSLNMLLMHAHRHNLLTRTRPMPPHFTRPKTETQTYALLRPIITRLVSIRNLEACLAYVSDLVAVWKRAGSDAFFKLWIPRPSIVSTRALALARGSASQTLIRALLTPIDFVIHINLMHNVWFNLRGRTFLFPVVTTFYHVLNPVSRFIVDVCPPFVDGYTELDTLTDYLRPMSSRILAQLAEQKLNANANAAAGPENPRWAVSIRGNSLLFDDRDDFELFFEVQDVDEKPTIRVRAHSVVDGAIVEEKWIWSRDSVSESRPMQVVLAEIHNRKSTET